MRYSPNVIKISHEVISTTMNTLLLRYPFLNKALLQLKEPKVYTGTGSFGTDGTRIYYNPAFIIKDYKENPGKVTHDLMHVIFHCIFRHNFNAIKGDKNIQYWNLACDMAVETLIESLQIPDLPMPSGYIAEKDFIDQVCQNVPSMTAEHIYQYLIHNMDLSFAEDQGEKLACDDHMVWGNADIQFKSSKSGSFADYLKSFKSHDMPDEKFENLDDKIFNKSGQEAEDEPDFRLTDEELKELAENEKLFMESETANNEAQKPYNGRRLNSTNWDRFSAEGQKRDSEWKDISEYIASDITNWENTTHGFNAGNLASAISGANQKEKYSYDEFLDKFAKLTEVMEPDLDQFDTNFYTYGMNNYSEKLALIEPLEYSDKKRVRDFVIAIDTSGSVDNETVKAFLRKSYNILHSRITANSGINVHIVQCDTEIQHVTKITSPEEFDKAIKNFTVYGRGGTDFKPVFRYVEEEKKKHNFSDFGGVVYFTDGYGDFPQQNPGYPTAFVFMREDTHCQNVPAWAIKLEVSKYDFENDKDLGSGSER